MNVFEQAIVFAVEAHAGMKRKGENAPYITHPMEAATIAATVTDDLEVLAAAVLHDVVEDTPCTMADIRERFGGRIASLVAVDNEDKREDRPAAETWKIRKQETLAVAAAASREEKIVVLADKLANLRSIHREFLKIGARFWDRFNMKDPEEHLWYYGSFIPLLAEFEGTTAYAEFLRLYEELCDGVRSGTCKTGVAFL